jgi:hypothetical protein
VDPFPVPDAGDVLAWEPPADDGGSRRVLIDLLHSAQVGDPGPALLEHRGRVGVGLHVPQGLCSKHPLDRDVKAPDAAERRAVGEVTHGLDTEGRGWR